MSSATVLDAGKREFKRSRDGVMGKVGKRVVKRMTG
jgi:hypothetical protein